MAIKSYEAFKPPSPYEQERRRAEQQRRYAEMLQQQSMAPEQEPYTFQGFRAMPSPLNALSRVLQAYGSKKAMERAEEAEGKAREADIAGMTELQKSLGPQTRVVEPDMFADPMAMASKYTPPPTETTLPTYQQRETTLTNALASGTPSAQRLAQLMLSRQPQMTMEALMSASQESRRKYQETGDPSVLELAPKAANLPGEVETYNYYVQDEQRRNKPVKSFEDWRLTKPPSTVIQMPPSARDLQKDESALRDQLEARLNKMDWAGTQSAMQRILTAPETAVGDVDIVYAVAKAADPSGAVRKEDFDLRAKEGSLGGQLQSAYEEAKSGRMRPQRRQQLIDSALNFYKAREATVNKLLSDYQGIAERSNLDVRNVIEPFKPMPLWSSDDEKELQRLRNKAAGN